MMRKRFICLILSVFLVGEAVCSSAPVQLKATVQEYDASFTLSSPVSGELKVKVRTAVHEKSGLPFAAFAVFTDSYRNLSSFSGKIEAGGKTIRKVKLSDLTTLSLSSGLADDSYAVVYEPNAPCPCVVEYEYTVSYKKGIASFPVFAPVEDPDVSVSSATFTLKVPHGYKIQYKATSEPETVFENSGDRYLWTVKDFPGYVSEHLGPSVMSLIPYVYSGPVEFSYAGTHGSLASWKDMGRWIYGLQEDVLNVPPDMKDKVLEMVKGVDDDFQKVRILYDFLRTHTRYVSIQLGIGGLKPFPVETVWKTGYGDCKALSVFMQAMLQVVGIKSDYVIVHTDKMKFMDGYHSPGQMNHAMLRVPMQNDTLWIECTNPRIPLGYRHESVAGHEVIVVEPDGGQKVVVPSYDDSLRFTSESADVILSADGSAVCNCSRKLLLDRVEPYIGFADWKHDEKFDAMMSGNSLSPSDFRILSVEDNFDAYQESSFIPEMKVSYSFRTSRYAKVSGDRIFMDRNPFAKKLYSERGERVNRMVIGRGRTLSDTVRIALPDGYEVESVPASDTITSDFGTMETRILAEGGYLNVVQTIVLKSGTFPKESYSEYRNFARDVSKKYSARIVLIRKPE